MKMSDVKQAHSLGVNLHFQFIGVLDGKGWSCCAFLQDTFNTDNEGWCPFSM